MMFLAANLQKRPETLCDVTLAVISEPMFTGSLSIPWKLPTYLSPKITLTLTFYLGQNIGLGRGRLEVSQLFTLVMAPPSWVSLFAPAGFVARRFRTHALRLLNSKKRRDCSQSTFWVKFEKSWMRKRDGVKFSSISLQACQNRSLLGDDISLMRINC